MLTHADSSVKFVVPVASWALWEPSVSEEGAASSPDVRFVDPLVRRRLSLLSRMSLRVAEDCVGDTRGWRFVFASRHGELSPTIRLLESIADEEVLSPALFSASVLNTATGLFSILKKNTEEASAISAGTSSFAYGLMEAALQWIEDPARPVLFVYADEEAPSFFRAGDPVGSLSHALALLLSDASTPAFNIRGERLIVPHQEDGPSEPQSMSFLRCLAEGEAEAKERGALWRWQKALSC